MLKKIKFSELEKCNLKLGMTIFQGLWATEESPWLQHFILRDVGYIDPNKNKEG